jgi:hypothetical protein
LRGHCQSVSIKKSPFHPFGGKSQCACIEAVAKLAKPRILCLGDAFRPEGRGFCRSAVLRSLQGKISDPKNNHFFCDTVTSPVVLDCGLVRNTKRCFDQAAAVDSASAFWYGTVNYIVIVKIIFRLPGMQAGGKFLSPS